MPNRRRHQGNYHTILALVYLRGTQGRYVRSCTLRIGTPWLNVAPVADGNAYDVEARILDLPEVVERDEALPVVSQGLSAGFSTKLLAERPLVDDRPFARAVALEDGGRDEAVRVLVSLEQTTDEVIAYGSRTSQPLYKVSIRVSRSWTMDITQG